MHDLMCLANCGHNSAWLEETELPLVFLESLLLLVDWLVPVHTHTHTVIQITLINGEKLISSCRNGGRSLSLSRSPDCTFPSTATHSSWSQLCADRLGRGEFLLWFTLIHCIIVLCAGRLHRQMCSLLSKLVSASAFHSSYIRWNQMGRYVLKNWHFKRRAWLIPHLFDGRWTKLHDLLVSTPKAP